jgi:integrase
LDIGETALNLETRNARRKLAPSGKPYYRKLDKGLFLGYRKNANGGTWTARLYVEAERDYAFRPLGAADDTAEPDGVLVLSFTQAQEAARKARRAAANVAEPTPTAYRVSDCLADYLDWLTKQKRNARTLRDVAKKIATTFNPALGGIRCDRLTTKVLQDWLDALADRPAHLRSGKPRAVTAETENERKERVRRRRCTANKDWAILRAALERAYKAGKISDASPWQRVEKFKKVARSRARFLTHDECRRLVNASAPDPDFRDLVLAGLYTGARYSELADMVVSDLHPESGTIHVPFPKQGKPHTIHLDDAGVAFFERAVAKAKGRLVFTRAGERWGSSWQSARMKAACKAARITPAVGFHTLRHTWASLAVMNGMNLKVVADNLGHTTTRMTEFHYAHLAPSYKAKQVREHAPDYGFAAEGVVTPLRRAARRR